MTPDDVKLDPRKFDNDFPHVPETPESDAEDFEFIFEAGLSVPKNSTYYDQWVAWLAKNHPQKG